MDTVVVEFKKISDFILSNKISTEMFEVNGITYIRFSYEHQIFLISCRLSKYILTIDNVYYLAGCGYEDIIPFLEDVFDGKEPKRSKNAVLLEKITWQRIK